MQDRTTGTPRPEDVTTTAEFVAALGRLRKWSGLTYRQLAARATAAGDVLPPSTTATVLGRAKLPREDFVAVFVRACGFDEVEVARWVAARKSLAAGTTPAPMTLGEQDGPPADVPVMAAPADEMLDVKATPDDDGEVPRRVWRLLSPARIVLTVTVLAILTVVALMRGADGSGNRDTQATPAPKGSVVATLPTGWYGLTPSHVADRDLCVGEGRERNGRSDRPIAVQRPCDDLLPDTSLRALGGGVYVIEWHHPKEGVGCLVVDGAFVGGDALLGPVGCDDAADQQYRLEPTGEGFKVRPVHSGWCLGALYGPRDVGAGAEIAQVACEDRPDQIFLIRPRPAPKKD
ncbi:XRE family transcriptional regulator [Streptosporangium sp. KLBMP 9127]|nr:helix-turn-helix domain-containing protein [Streptosporangium sp. KLBMP 9127]